MIGHELAGNPSRVNWFLAQQWTPIGYTQAIFSGLPTVEIGRVILEYVLPHADLCGLYHVAAAPINKYDLLRLIAAAYKKPIEVIADDKLKIDRSLDASRFNAATGYQPAEWPELIKRMEAFR